MNKDLEKFRELLLTDQEFQQKLQDAAEAYTGPQTEETVFDSVLVPIAAEYGITATYDEFKVYMESLNNDTELSKEELSQVAGGGKGGGAVVCIAVGVGGGGGGGNGTGGGCAGIGIGWGAVICSGSGKTQTPSGNAGT